MKVVPTYWKRAVCLTVFASMTLQQNVAFAQFPANQKLTAQDKKVISSFIQKTNLSSAENIQPVDPLIRSYQQEVEQVGQSCVASMMDEAPARAAPYQIMMQNLFVDFDSTPMIPSKELQTQIQQVQQERGFNNRLADLSDRASNIFQRQVVDNWMMMDEQTLQVSDFNQIDDLPAVNQVTNIWSSLPSVEPLTSSMMQTQLNFLNYWIDHVNDLCSDSHKKYRQMQKALRDSNKRNPVLNPGIKDLLGPVDPHNVVRADAQTILRSRIDQLPNGAIYEGGLMVALMHHIPLLGTWMQNKTNLQNHIGIWEPLACVRQGQKLHNISMQQLKQMAPSSMHQMKKHFQKALADHLVNRRSKSPQELILQFIEYSPKQLLQAMIAKPSRRDALLLCGMVRQIKADRISKEDRDDMTAVLLTPMIAAGLVYKMGVAGKFLRAVSLVTSLYTLRDRSMDLKNSYEIEQTLQNAIAAGQINALDAQATLRNIQSARPFSYVSIALATAGVAAVVAPKVAAFAKWQIKNNRFNASSSPKGGSIATDPDDFKPMDLPGPASGNSPANPVSGQSSPGSRPNRPAGLLASKLYSTSPSNATASNELSSSPQTNTIQNRAPIQAGDPIAKGAKFNSDPLVSIYTKKQTVDVPSTRDLTQSGRIIPPFISFNNFASDPNMLASAVSNSAPVVWGSYLPPNSNSVTYVEKMRKQARDLIRSNSAMFVHELKWAICEIAKETTSDGLAARRLLATFGQVCDESDAANEIKFSVSMNGIRDRFRKPPSADQFIFPYIQFQYRFNPFSPITPRSFEAAVIYIDDQNRKMLIRYETGFADWLPIDPRYIRIVQVGVISFDRFHFSNSPTDSLQNLFRQHYRSGDLRYGDKIAVGEEIYTVILMYRDFVVVEGYRTGLRVLKKEELNNARMHTKVNVPENASPSNTTRFHMRQPGIVPLRGNGQPSQNPFLPLVLSAAVERDSQSLPKNLVARLKLAVPNGGYNPKASDFLSDLAKIATIDDAIVFESINAFVTSLQSSIHTNPRTDNRLMPFDVGTDRANQINRDIAQKDRDFVIYNQVMTRFIKNSKPEVILAMWRLLAGLPTAQQKAYWNLVIRLNNEKLVNITWPYRIALSNQMNRNMRPQLSIFNHANQMDSRIQLLSSEKIKYFNENSKDAKSGLYLIQLVEPINDGLISNPDENVLLVIRANEVIGETSDTILVHGYPTVQNGNGTYTVENDFPVIIRLKKNAAGFFDYDRMITSSNRTQIILLQQQNIDPTHFTPQTIARINQESNVANRSLENMMKKFASLNLNATRNVFVHASKLSSAAFSALLELYKNGQSGSHFRFGGYQIGQDHLKNLVVANPIMRFDPPTPTVDNTVIMVQTKDYLPISENWMVLANRDFYLHRIIQEVDPITKKIKFVIFLY